MPKIVSREINCLFYSDVMKLGGAVSIRYTLNEPFIISTNSRKGNVFEWQIVELTYESRIINSKDISYTSENVLDS